MRDQPGFLRRTWLATVVLGVCVGSACGNGQGGMRGDASAGGTGGSGGAGGMGGCSPTYLPCWDCGDGRLDPGEECDDGNLEYRDGCNALCQMERGYTCTGGQCTSLSYCGDGMVTAGEACDDGRGTAVGASGIGCRTDCQAIEPGWFCPSPGQPCQPLGAPSTSVDAGTCADAGGPCLSTCGDGTVNPGEACDLGSVGNDGSYGRCSPLCTLAPHCGDGVVNGPEECDVGSLNVAAYGDQDGCTPGCFNARFCGDGVVDGVHGEACDLGDLNGSPGQRCALGCTVIGTRWTECVRVCL